VRLRTLGQTQQRKAQPLTRFDYGICAFGVAASLLVVLGIFGNAPRPLIFIVEWMAAFICLFFALCVRAQPGHRFFGASGKAGLFLPYGMQPVTDTALCVSAQRNTMVVTGFLGT
jgi:hypothetical protein